ncbi:MAG TPA: uracil phosphoribosyltransferase [Candidatus Kapabacteria bacterium]|nr:uracil phosphoribosyltransferase [Candidatus Kapabacteria bacterium]
MIKVLEHPLVNKDISILRSKDTNPEEFRNAINRIAYHLAIEAYYDLPTVNIEVTTPLEVTKGVTLPNKVLLIPILRAGLTLLNAFEKILPDVQIGYCALKRDENSFKIEEYYYSLPKVANDTLVIILDVMLATGNSLITLLTKLQLEAINNIKVISIIAAPEGLEQIAVHFPNIEIITATIDRELNQQKYILPGLGDAGDRANNT